MFRNICRAALCKYKYVYNANIAIGLKYLDIEIAKV